MKNPVIDIGSVAASGKVRQPGDIPLIRTRLFSITAMATHNASATAGHKINVYYSPDGSNWDTEAFTSFQVAVSAGNRAQRTAPIIPPGHGYIKFEIENEDSTYTITDVKGWYTIDSWPFGFGPSRGDITKEEGTEGF